MPTSKPLTAKMLFDKSELTGRMLSNGLSVPTSKKKAKLFTRCAESLQKHGMARDAEARCFFVPGRIEVLGKHTDYAGGRSIVAAVDKGFCIIAAARNDAAIRIFNVVDNEQVQFSISSNIQPQVGHWSNYPMTVVRRLAKNFAGLAGGCDIAFASDLPAAGGMSSSTAMVVGFFLCLSDCNEIKSREEYRRNIKSTEDLAAYLGCVENGQSFGTLAGDKGVGTFGGSEDHIAILCSKADSLSQYSYCPIRFKRILQLPSDYTFAVASSGVIAEKTGSAMEKYNRASNLCRHATEVWNKATGREDPHLAAAIASDSGAAEHMRKVLEQSHDGQFKPEELIKRFEHFLVESEKIIPAAGNALAEGDLGEFGRQVDLSQEFTETMLCNQVPETIFLANCARKLGAAAASAFGAGFGGSVWALTKADKAQEFITEWSAVYKKQFPKAAANALFLFTRPGPAAFEL